MNPAWIIAWGVLVWIARATFAWAFIHGAAKLRQQEDAMHTAAAPGVKLPATSPDDAGSDQLAT